MGITISKLQKYIKEKDSKPSIENGYFLKLAEEVGELSRAIRKKAPPATEETLKGSMEEEVYDVLYYTLAIANQYDIEVEKWVYLKEKLNDKRYNSKHADKLLD